MQYALVNSLRILTAGRMESINCFMVSKAINVSIYFKMERTALFTTYSNTEPALLETRSWSSLIIEKGRGI